MKVIYLKFLRWGFLTELCLYIPWAGFEPGPSSEHLLEIDACSEPLSHHGRFICKTDCLEKFTFFAHAASFKTLIMTQLEMVKL